jgi:thiol-disulfide isomerase/thioredoxin
MGSDPMSPWKRPAVILALSAAAFLLVAAVYLRGPGRGPAAGGPAADPNLPLVVQLLRDPVTIPPFTVTDLDGRTLRSTDWLGKVVLVNFWATWCPPCLAEIPDLVALQREYRDRLVIVGVSEDHGPVEFVKSFAADRNVNYPLVMATPELRERFSGIIALPTTFVLDPDGRMVKKHVGLLSGREAEAMTRALTGLSVDVTVERVEDPGRLSVARAAQITSIPGIDLGRVPAERRVALLQTLNNEKCTCGCDLSVAKCRIDDPTCEISLPVAQKIVDTFLGQGL